MYLSNYFDFIKIAAVKQILKLFSVMLSLNSFSTFKMFRMNWHKTLKFSAESSLYLPWKSYQKLLAGSFPSPNSFFYAALFLLLSFSFNYKIVTLYWFFPFPLFHNTWHLSLAARPTHVWHVNILFLQKFRIFLFLSLYALFYRFMAIWTSDNIFVFHNDVKAQFYIIIAYLLVSFNNRI